MKRPLLSASPFGSYLSMASSSSGANVDRSAVAARIASVGMPSPEPSWSRIRTERSRFSYPNVMSSLRPPIIADKEYRQQTARQVPQPIFRDEQVSSEMAGDPVPVV